MLTQQELQGLVDRALGDRLNEVQLVNLRWKLDEDREGSPLVILHAIYADECGRLSVREISQLLNEIRPALREKGAVGQPILYHFLQSEYGDQATEVL